MYLPPLLIKMYSRFAVSYSSLETARQPSLKGGCCALTDDGVNAISIAPTSKKRKKTAVQSDFCDLLISNLPMAVGRMSGPFFKYELIAGSKRDQHEHAAALARSFAPGGEQRLLTAA
jgi:hypothetical protein